MNRIAIRVFGVVYNIPFTLVINEHDMVTGTIRSTKYNIRQGQHYVMTFFSSGSRGGLGGSQPPA